MGQVAAADAGASTRPLSKRKDLSQMSNVETTPLAEIWIEGPDGRYDVIAHWKECLAAPYAEDFATRREIAAVVKALEELHHGK